MKLTGGFDNLHLSYLIGGIFAVFVYGEVSSSKQVELFLGNLIDGVPITEHIQCRTWYVAYVMMLKVHA